MAIKKLKPTTPGRRGMSTISYDSLLKKRPEKKLTSVLKKTAGRDNRGTISIRRRGGRHKRKYRVIDFKRSDKLGVPAIVKTIEYDPNRSAFIALLYYSDGEKRYILAPEKLKIGDKVITNEKTKMKAGNRLQIKNIPTGFSIYNIELNPGKGGQIVRSAGSSAKLMSLEGRLAQIQLPSGEIRLVNKDCYATIGTVSNCDHTHVKIGKAGRSRWLGKRPKVRGKAMNPCDHPHGGGEGGSPIGLKHPKTPWGTPALGVKTRKRKKKSNIFIVRTRKGKQVINV